MKKRKRMLHLSDEGFSLMELVVTLLVSAVVTAAVAGFLSAGMRYYWNADHETKLQTESQITELFVTELIQESIDYKDLPATGVTKAYEIKRQGVTSVLILKEDQLWFSDVADGASDADKIQAVINKGKEGAFLAEHVTDFSITPATRGEALTTSKGVVFVDVSFDFSWVILSSGIAEL